VLGVLLADELPSERMEQARVESGFGVVRTSDRPGVSKLDQFLGDPVSFRELLERKLLLGDA
jgi:hypothetical protein